MNKETCHLRLVQEFIDLDESLDALLSRLLTNGLVDSQTGVLCHRLRTIGAIEVSSKLFDLGLRPEDIDTSVAAFSQDLSELDFIDAAEQVLTLSNIDPQTIIGELVHIICLRIRARDDLDAAAEFLKAIQIKLAIAMICGTERESALTT